jgi:hypothetical protein
MPVSDTSPNAANLAKGSGIAYWQGVDDIAERDLGYCELVRVTPNVPTTDKMAARGGKRQRIKTFVGSEELTYDVTLMETTPSNLALSFGGAKADPVSLSTTGDFASASKKITALAATTDLVKGRRYDIAGTGIAAGTKGWYDGNAGFDLDTATTGVGADEALTITCVTAFTVFETAQQVGRFRYVGDNEEGAKVEMEALNCVLTPSGGLELLNSANDNVMQIELKLAVNVDTYGNTAQVYFADFAT